MINISMKEFSESLAELMSENGFTNQSLADGLAIERSTISRYLRDEKMPSFENLVALAQKFNCSTDYLLGLTDKKYTQNFLPCPPFSKRLGELLDYFEISQYKLEKDTEIAHSVFGYWKTGKTLPSANNLIKIAKALNCTVDFVLGRTKE